MNNAPTDNAMLEETGEVVAIEGAYAVIETQPRSACGHCSVGDSCGTSVLASLFSKRRGSLRLRNHLELSVGDRAIIGIHESVLLSTAVMAYLLPLLLMIALAVVADLYGAADNMTFAISMLGLFIGMRVSNRIMGNKDFQSGDIVLLRNANESIIRMADETDL